MFVVEKSCQQARDVVAACAEKYKDLIELIPKDNYYRLVSRRP